MAYPAHIVNEVNHLVERSINEVAFLDLSSNPSPSNVKDISEVFVDILSNHSSDKYAVINLGDLFKEFTDLSDEEVALLNEGLNERVDYALESLFGLADQISNEGKTVVVLVEEPVYPDFESLPEFKDFLEKASIKLREFMLNGPTTSGPASIIAITKNAFTDIGVTPSSSYDGFRLQPFVQQSPPMGL